MLLNTLTVGLRVTGRVYRPVHLDHRHLRSHLPVCSTRTPKLTHLAIHLISDIHPLARVRRMCRVPASPGQSRLRKVRQTSHSFLFLISISFFLLLLIQFTGEDHDLVWRTTGVLKSMFVAFHHFPCEYPPCDYPPCATFVLVLSFEH